MSNSTITFPSPDSIITTVREIADELPDFVYTRGLLPNEGCRYEADGHGDCIIGRALERLGVPIEHIRWLDTASQDGDGIAVFQIWHQPFWNVPKTEEGKSIFWLSEVQREQDNGAPWGEAVRRADSRTTEFALRHQI